MYLNTHNIIYIYTRIYLGLPCFFLGNFNRISKEVPATQMASSLSKVEAMRTSPRWSLDFDPKSGAAPVFFVSEICYGFLMDMFSSMGIFFVGFLYWFIFMDVLNGVCLFVRLYVVCLKRRREGIAWRPDVSWSSWCLKLGIGVVDVAAVFGCCCWLDQHTRIYISICAFEMNLTVSSQYRVLANGATWYVCSQQMM